MDTWILLGYFTFQVYRYRILALTSILSADTVCGYLTLQEHGLRNGLVTEDAVRNESVTGSVLSPYVLSPLRTDSDSVTTPLRTTFCRCVTD